MFQNGQHTLLLWHNIQAHVPITIASNGTSSYENYKAPFNHNCLRDSNYYTLKFKHPLTYTLYAHAHTGTL